MPERPNAAEQRFLWVVAAIAAGLFFLPHVSDSPLRSGDDALFAWDVIGSAHSGSLTLACLPFLAVVALLAAQLRTSPSLRLLALFAVAALPLFGGAQDLLGRVLHAESRAFFQGRATLLLGLSLLAAFGHSLLATSPRPSPNAVAAVRVVLASWFAFLLVLLLPVQFEEAEARPPGFALAAAMTDVAHASVVHAINVLYFLPLVMLPAAAWVAVRRPNANTERVFARVGLLWVLIVATTSELATAGALGHPARALESLRALGAVLLFMIVANRCLVKLLPGLVWRGAPETALWTCAPAVPMRRAVALLLAAFAGVLRTVASPGFDQQMLAFVAFIPLFFAVDGATPREAFWRGWLSGTVTNLGCFYWITDVLMRFGGLSYAASLPLNVLLVAFQGLQTGLFTYLLVRLTRGAQPTRIVWLAPTLYVALELVCPMLFPWFIANSQYRFLSFIQIAEVTGVYGVSFLIILINLAFFLALRSTIAGTLQPTKLLAFTAAITLVNVVYGSIRISQVEGAMRQSPAIRVGIVQSNVGIDERRQIPDGGHRRHQEMSAGLLRDRRPPHVIIWPESSWWNWISRDAKKVPDVQAGNRVPLIFGAGRREAGKSYNTSFLLDADGTLIDHYDKVYLLAFGEYLPLESTFPFLRKAFPAAGAFSTGESVKAFPIPFGDRVARAGMMICYEDLLPTFTRRLADLRPHFFANVTNDAWFGKSHEPAQHRALAIFRSIEHRRFLLRATLTGISCVVDATGRIVRETEIYAPATLNESVALLEGDTPYRHLGDTFAWLCLAAALGVPIATRLLKKRSIK
ncbi:MAG: apolipoprotein N-acyltransferase [Deltaproteobacteria bacterium]|nr:apolipoprotein N-acyltransferase [Deltaproteobacteria bacterium]